MRTANSWGRSILALAAVLLVAGPGLVLANNPGPSYLPRIVEVVKGPGTITPNANADYDAKVTFTNGAICVFTGAEATWTASAGSIDPVGGFTAPGSAQRVAISAAYSNGGRKASGTRYIRVQ